jgi:hypothetical protein
MSCPCDTRPHPLPLDIGAGLTVIPRQVAGFTEFRRAMLADIRRHPVLADWRARSDDDLGVMLLELWALPAWRCAWPPPEGVLRVQRAECL